MSGKVSVIIPIHNVESYLHKCLQSVQEQTYQNLQVILVDDASTDQSGTIAQEYAERNAWEYYKLDGRGAGRTRNEALSYVKGNYIFFLDSDDYLVSNAIEIAVSKLEEKKLDVFGFSAYTFNDDNEDQLAWDTSGYKYIGDYSNPCTGIDCLKQIIKNGDADITCCWLFLISSEYWKRKELLFPEGIILEDNYTHLMLILNADRISIENIPLYCHRYHLNSVMGTANDEKNVCALGKLLNMLEEIWRDRKDLDTEIMAYYMHDYAWKYAGNLMKIPAKKRNNYMETTKNVKEISIRHQCWDDKKLALFTKHEGAFWFRQKIRKLVKG